MTVDLHPDLPVLLFNLTISLLTGLIFGVAPAIHAVRENVGESLKANAAAASIGRAGLGLRGGLVAAQVALSMLLLTAGGLLIQTLQNLRNQDLGFRAAGVLSIQFQPQGQYKPAWPDLITELLQRAKAVPGVESASVSFDGVLGGAGGIRGFRFEASPAPPGKERAGASWVSPGYFQTAGISLLEGREFSLVERANSLPVVIVSRTMARRYTGSDRAVGRKFVFNGKSYEIVGVAEDAKHGDLRQPFQPFVYFSALQSASAVHSLEVRTALPPSGVASEIRSLIRDVDPRLRVVTTETLEQLLRQKLGREILVANLAGFFAGVTLLLVVLGVYGTAAYSVARRTKEIGIRIALGARPSNITSLVLRRLVFAICGGLILGTALGMAAGRLLEFLLFGLAGTDAQTIGAAGLLLSLAALIAGYLPVRRALRLDPTTALRLE
jgi:predicted permease